MSTGAKTDVSALLARVQDAAASGKLSGGSAENIAAWLTRPHYTRYKPQLRSLIESGKYEELDALFWEVISFGTAGRRGPMADLGSATINERTIAESAHGLAAYLKKQKGGLGGAAAVAHDTRNRSAEFARLTARVLAAHGIKVYLFESHRATPELSFAVRRLGCDIGAMISASHNPPADNGFKAYWSNGGQVFEPHDRGIIECVYQAEEIPLADFDQAVKDGQIEIVGETLDREYIDTLLALSLSRQRDIPAIFSPLHGVGETSVYRVLQEAGFGGVQMFEPQREPDGNFPNVPDQLPNPERPEVFGPLIAAAKNAGVDLVLASDPDADRLGVCVRRPGGEFVHLSGNQIGTLLVDYVLRKRAAAGTLTPQHYVVETLVTTPLIAAIARAHGVRAIDDLLVGFKYIGETMDNEGPERFVFGAEESLGYLAGTYCRDKDAAIAALYLAELAAELRKDEKTLLDRLDEIYEARGYFTEGQRSEVCRGPRGQQQIQELMAAFRKTPPTELAGVKLARVRDYKQHEVRQLPGNTRAGDLPQPDGNLIFFDSAEGAFRLSVAVRPSGTEPKIKFYFFAQGQRSGSESLEAVKSRTTETLRRVQDGLSEWVQKTLAG